MTPDIAARGLGQSKLRSIEFSRLLERICNRKRCLGQAAEGLNPIERNTL
jgi:hypothetical protein